jgi:chemotaxis protein CheY-P-specific phosphatase CheC
MKLTDDQLDALGELFNIGVGKGADNLNQMPDCQIQIRVPHLEVLSLSDLKEQEQNIPPKLNALSFCSLSRYSGKTSILTTID